MNHFLDIRRTSFLLLAVTLGACPPEAGETESTGTSTGTGSTTGGDPTPTTTTPTTDETTGDPTSTTGATTGTTDVTTGTTDATTGPVDPTTGTTTTGPATDSSTGGTTDGTSSTTDDTTDSGTDGTSSTGEPVQPTDVLVTANPGGLSTDALVGLAPGLATVTTTQTPVGDVVSIQSVVARGPNVFITYDGPAGGGLMFIEQMPFQPKEGPIGLGTHIITGKATGLIAPRGLEGEGPDGLILVADIGAGIHAFVQEDVGDAPPQFTITDLGGAEAVWDVHYDGNTDTLYAAGTNGEVLAYDDFSTAQGQSGPDRTIVPAQDDSKISINLHGITVNGTKLYLSDVGDPMSDIDGQVFVIADVAGADGKVEVLQRIQGGDLGNPVDLELRPEPNRALYVAEKAHDKLLVFREDPITNALMPAGEFAVTRPESVTLRASGVLFITNNLTGIDGDGIRMAKEVQDDVPVASVALAPIGSMTSIQSVALTPEGRGYVGFDGPAVSGGGGVFVVDGLTELAGEGQVDAVAERLWGAETGIVTPKGIVLTQERLIVADTGAGNIKVFDLAGLGNVAPLFVFTDLGGGPVWDIAYDAVDDRLFAAGIDGVVRVFDGALASLGADAPARLIVPTDGKAKISVNLHGIHYDAATKTLLLSDVGDAMNNADGAILLIADADAVDGEVEVLAAIRGDKTELGNPVDLAFDGAALFVAEKSNSAILRYDAILDFTGVDNNQAEDAMIAVQNAESVQVVVGKP